MKKALFLTLISGSSLLSHAQKPKAGSLQAQLTGTWELVAVDNIYPDSSRVRPYGTDPKGMLVFDEKGNYAIQILRAQRPKVASGDKNKCTPEEYAVLVQGSNSHFGKYAIDESGKTIVFKIEHASFPNWKEPNKSGIIIIPEAN